MPQIYLIMNINYSPCLIDWQDLDRIEAAMFIAGRPVSVEELGIKLELKKKETEELIIILRQFQNRVNARLERLSPVWRAVEWWDSCDTSEDGVKKALSEYRGENND